MSTTSSTLGQAGAGASAVQGSRRLARPTGLTGAQRGIVAACLREPGSSDFVVGDVVRLSGVGAGALDASSLAAAARAVLSGAVDLRLVWQPGEGYGRLVPGALPELGFHDLSGHADAWGEALALATRDATQPLPLDAASLLRVRVFELGGGECALSLVVHHVLLDGYGVHLVLRRIVQAACSLVPAEAPFADPAEVVLREENYAGSPAAAADREYWASHRAPAHAALRFVEEPPAAEAGEGRAPTHVRLDLGCSGAQLDAEAVAAGTDLASLLLAAHAMVLSAHAARDDVVIGVPLMQRLGPGAKALTATVNVLPVQVNCQARRTVRELLEGTARSLGEVRRHGRMRAEELYTLHEHHRWGTEPTGSELNIKLFDALPTPAGSTLQIHNLAEGPVSDVSISVHLGERAELELRAPGILSASRLLAIGEGLALAVRSLVEAAAAGGGATLASLEVFRPDSVDAARPVPGARPMLGERLAHLARLRPAESALLHGSEEHSFAQLWAAVSVRIGWLSARTGRGDAVLLDAGRSLSAIAWYFAIMASGRTAVPLDEDWPLERKAAIEAGLAEAGRRPLRVTASTRVALDVDPAVVEAALAETRSTDIAYLIHTSGSTGVPKAVAITQGALATHLAVFGEQMWGQPRTAALTLPLVFDGSWDMLSAVTWGSRVVLIDHTTARDPRACVAALRAAGVSSIDSTPTIVQALLDEGLLEPGHAVAQINVGGEACPQALWQRLCAVPGVVARNYYGPTESTVDATRRASDLPDAAGDRTGIGQAVEGTTALVLDRALRPLPYGTRGELYLAGDQLALGYLGDAAKTAERFVARPGGAPGERMYRTGDLARMFEDGSLMYEGRGDQQIKLRGYRVEPGEVEAALESLPGVSKAVVRADGTRLVAWAMTGREPSEVLAAVARLLPAYLVPAALVPMREFPRTATGKLDAAALPLPAAAPTAEPVAVPLTSTQRRVAESISSVLRLGERGASLPGPASDFFALGGDSITAIGLVSRLREAGLASSVSSVFSARTVDGIAAACAPLTDTAAPAVPTLHQDAASVDAVAALLAARRTRQESQSR